jgi:hypothetical protein
MGLGLIAVAAVLALLAPAAARAQYDAFDTQTLNADGGGNEVPYAGGAPLARAVPFNNSLYTTQAVEGGDGQGNSTGCVAGPNDVFWGAKTGWVRFVPAAAGTLQVTATSAHDVILWAWRGPNRPRSLGLTAFTELQNLTCNNAVQGSGGETIGNLRLEPNVPVHVEVASLCARGAPPYTASCPPAQAELAAGGDITLAFNFVPDNADGDAVPDTLDACPGTAGTLANGCPAPPPPPPPPPPPDSDGDGVPDASDNCPATRGSGADGCPVDGDGDGVLGAPNGADCDDANRSVHPGAAEVSNNDVDENCDGRKAIDRDRDGVLARPLGADCDDNNRLRAPGRREVRGNRVDEDCDGRALDYTRIASVVDLDFRAFSSYTMIDTLTVQSVPRGATVTLRCTGTGCPFARRRLTVTRATRSLVLGRLLANRRLGVGAVVEVHVTRAATIGKVRRFVIRRRARPTAATLCLRPGATRPAAC